MAFLTAMMVLLVSCSSPQASPSVEPGVATPDALAFDGEDDVLRIAMVQPSSADPADLVLTDQAQVILSDLLYDGLTEVEANSGRLRPGLATSWTSNDEFTAWTFELDPDRLTAEQIKSSFERQRNQQSAVVRDLMSIVDAVEVESKFELRFELNRPSAGFPWLLSGPGMAVSADSGVSSSRFTLISEDSNGLVLASPGGLSDINVRWTDSEKEATALVDSGDVDVAVGDSAEGASSAVLGHVRFVAINSSSPNLVDAADRARVQSIVASAVGSSTTDLGSSIAGIDGLSSPALAGSSTLLCKSGCGLGAGTPVAPATPEIELKLGVSSTGDVALGEMIRDGFEGSNITVTLVEASPSEMARMISAGDIDLSVFGWVAGASSLDAVVPTLLESSSPANIFQLHNDQIDSLLLEASLIEDDTQRWRLLAEAESIAISDGVVVPIGAIRSKVRLGDDASSLMVRADGTLDTFRY